MAEENHGASSDTIQIIKLILNILWGILITAYYIILDIYHIFSPREKKSLKGQHVLVTGAGRGLGREFALRFAKEGCRITCVDVDKNGCDETVSMINKDFPDTAKSYNTDITSQEQIAKLAEVMKKENGPLDILVNNAGIVSAQNLMDVTPEHVKRMVEVNLMSHFWTVKQFLPDMKSRKKGHIVAVSSVAAFTVAANIAPYSATKCAVTGLMGCLREELRFTFPDIHTTTVHPFFISPPQKYQHWSINSILPEVTAADVAAAALSGLKQNKKTVTIPSYMYYTLLLIHSLPTKAADLWRDIFFAKINN